MLHGIATGRIQRVAFIRVNTEGECIIVDEEHGLATDEAPSAACLCGTCQGPMRLLSFNPHAALRSSANSRERKSLLVCPSCGLRVHLPSAVIWPTELAEHFGPAQVRSGVCGRCLGEKTAFVRPLTLHGKDISSIERVTCPACHGSGNAA